MRDVNTGKSRGFGYITMLDSMVIEEILNRQPHYIDNKMVECKIAIPKDHLESSKNNSQTYTNFLDKKSRKKVFVGGLPMMINEHELYDYFLKYGKIEECSILQDKNKGNSRGFGFVIFKNDESVEMVMRDKNNHSIRGKWIDCKVALPKEKENAVNKTNLNEKTVNTPPKMNINQGYNQNFTQNNNNNLNEMLLYKNHIYNSNRNNLNSQQQAYNFNIMNNAFSSNNNVNSINNPLNFQHYNHQNNYYNNSYNPQLIYMNTRMNQPKIDNIPSYIPKHIPNYYIKTIDKSKGIINSNNSIIKTPLIQNNYNLTIINPPLTTSNTEILSMPTREDQILHNKINIEKVISKIENPYLNKNTINPNSTSLTNRQDNSFRQTPSSKENNMQIVDYILNNSQCSTNHNNYFAYKFSNSSGESLKLDFNKAMNYPKENERIELFKVNEEEQRKYETEKLVDEQIEDNFSEVTNEDCKDYFGPQKCKIYIFY